MAFPEDARNQASDPDGDKEAANAAYLAEKRASGQLSEEDYALLRHLPTSHAEYLARFQHQSRHSILRAYLQDYLTVQEVMQLLRVK